MRDGHRRRRRKSDRKRWYAHFRQCRQARRMLGVEIDPLTTYLGAIRE